MIRLVIHLLIFSMTRFFGRIFPLRRSWCGIQTVYSQPPGFVTLLWPTLSVQSPLYGRNVTVRSPCAMSCGGWCFCSSIFDAVICIAVLHHLSTVGTQVPSHPSSYSERIVIRNVDNIALSVPRKERRLAVIAELVRIAAPGRIDIQPLLL